MNNLKSKFLEFLIFKPYIIEIINPDKIELHKSSNSYYLGEIENGKPKGYGKLISVNGNVYEGLWRNGHGVNLRFIVEVISPQDAKGLRRRGPALQGSELKRLIKLSDMELQELNIILDSKNNSIKKQTWMSIADVASIFKNPKINREKLKQE